MCRCLSLHSRWRHGELSTRFMNRLFWPTVVSNTESKGPVSSFLGTFGFIRAIGLNPSMQVLFVNDSGGLQVSPRSGISGQVQAIFPTTPDRGGLYLKAAGIIDEKNLH